MIPCPCNGCQKRFYDGTKTCHSTCEEYKEWSELNKAAKRDLMPKRYRSLPEARTGHRTLAKYRRRDK